MNNELLSLTLALVLIEDVESHNNGCIIDFDARSKTVYTTSGLFVKKIAEATGEEIYKSTNNYTHPDTGEQFENTYYQVNVKGWTLQTLQDPDTATR